MEEIIFSAVFNRGQTENICRLLTPRANLRGAFLFFDFWSEKWENKGRIYPIRYLLSNGARLILIYNYGRVTRIKKRDRKD
jgi:hypothetical protein